MDRVGDRDNRMPDCDVYLAARTGHWVQWERAELFNDLAANFLDAAWAATTYQGISIWGHHTVSETPLDKLAQLRTAAARLRTPEITVPELTGSFVR
jgi:hypothetical protein